MADTFSFEFSRFLKAVFFSGLECSLAAKDEPKDADGILPLYIRFAGSSTHVSRGGVTTIQSLVTSQQLLSSWHSRSHSSYSSDCFVKLTSLHNNQQPRRDHAVFQQNSIHSSIDADVLRIMHVPTAHTYAHLYFYLLMTIIMYR